MLNQHALIGSRIDGGPQHYTMLATPFPANTPAADVVWLPKLDANGTFNTPFKAPFSLAEALDRSINTSVRGEQRTMRATAITFACFAGAAVVIGVSIFVALPHAVSVLSAMFFFGGMATAASIWLHARNDMHAADVVADLMQGADEIRRSPQDRDPIEDHRIYTLSRRAAPLFAGVTKEIEDASLEYMAEYNRVHGDPRAIPRD